MSIRIIDNKKIFMDDREWDTYVKICRSYDRANFRGEELFKEIFESDNKGYITFIKPPSTRYTSFEVIAFLFSIFNSQQIRLMKAQVDKLIAETNEKVNVALAKI